MKSLPFIVSGSTSYEEEGDLDDIPAPEASGPYFETSVSKNVTALVGKTAYLNCRVRHLGNRTVSE